MRKLLFIISLLIMIYSCNSTSNKGTDNPFFSEFSTPNGVPPFDQIKAEHFLPAFKEGMARHNAEIDSIVNNPEAPTFENTVVALDESGRMLDRVGAVLSVMTGTMSDSVFQSIEKEITPMRTEHYDNINFNEKLFERIKAVHDDTTSVAKLTTEQKMLLNKTYKGFVRSGILLDGSKQARLREINKELSSASLSFNQNLLKETDNYQLVIDKKEDLAGLPDGIIAAAAKAAKDKGLEGKWVFGLSKPSWEPFLQYADNRELREKLYKAMYMRGDNGNEFDNKDNIKKIVSLRLERANILGYNTHADYVLEETMAKNPSNVMGLLNNIWKYALPQAKKELADLQAIAKKEGQDIKIESWDWWYYAEKVRKEKYALDEDALKPYFKADNVREGVFAVANKLYGITFKQRTDVPVYQQDVKAYEVSDADGSLIGLIYFDDYARQGKRPGAWMSSFRKQEVFKGDYVHPLIYNVGNYNPPTDGKPAMLTLDQVETMFHEFGHGLHGLLSKCNYYGVSGTAVVRDFVELPSQIMEHWAFEPEVLKMYAKHYETGEVIPDELIQKIENAGYFNQGFRTTELVAAAMLDMKWYTLTAAPNFNPKNIEGVKDMDVDKFEADAMKEIGLIDEIIPRYRSTYFQHIFSGGYSSGYYSYLWSEVLDSDAFQAFVEKGNIFDQETAKSFRENVLSKGGSDEPMTLYKKFRGAEPNPINLLKNRGFVK
ncbi:peptidyl-dipeptidase Dcp [Dysgonomonas sp. PFB1-18]|uniref:M3 family metallopeptidase n=1 Tax=unclassified Dysgonomonas TaxID=2630389 RepID=UPI00247545B0|nr:MULTISPECIES: M3 family metallopeptidase [unclassified Dysgonomonas]MDH6308198.1 peptidyl-dipeptidase Dcp [Dysgonomonas sp. PF1-14]MDH6338363.1 peptidyl-dipeptidase Dcp [Dysgonomonas sp. PF1-16]MDH6379860.1 peptidyl-dipeptidase Dcp [Dysgonomonas sp. PFB1-18]MDH6397050.1 peptidyl-dipeptidase Dcp [Dysgonomonas sp. PF1-23]